MMKMSVHSKEWVEELKANIVKALRNTPRPKGSPKEVDFVRYSDLFPTYKPGTGRFDMTGGKGRKDAGKDRKEEENAEEE
jgi:hypothetical protein